jgi:hypothetical protein
MYCQKLLKINPLLKLFNIKLLNFFKNITLKKVA